MDVGHGQVMGSIAQDPRVTVMERTNLRHLRPEQLPEQVTPACLVLLGSLTTCITFQMIWMMYILDPGNGHICIHKHPVPELEDPRHSYVTQRYESHHQPMFASHWGMHRKGQVLPALIRNTGV